jgi:hypothetical protein
MSLYEDSKDYEKHYGKISHVEIHFFYKYTYTLHLYLESGERITIYTGGDCSNIYRYDPLSTDWSEHCAAEIQSVEKN